MAHLGSDAHGAPYLDRSGKHALAEALTGSAAALDETRTPAPEAPDAGASTTLIGGLLAGMSDAIGDLVTALELTALELTVVSGQHSGQTLGAADQGGCPAR